MAHGYPAVTGFVETFLIATAFLVVGMLAGLLVPGLPLAGEPGAVEGQPAEAQVS
jgi:hypothetical protein